MSSTNEETLLTLQDELVEQLDALKTQGGLNETDMQVETSKLLLAFGAKIQAATVAQ